MTAAGTSGHWCSWSAGVADLAIAPARPARRVVSAYDVRPAVRQVRSGRKIPEIRSILSGRGQDTPATRGHDQEQELMFGASPERVVITTAAVPGKRPRSWYAEMVRKMSPARSLSTWRPARQLRVDPPGETVVDHGVTILGPTNLRRNLPRQPDVRQIATFLLNMVKGQLSSHGRRDHNETLVARDGKIVHPRVLGPKCGSGQGVAAARRGHAPYRRLRSIARPFSGSTPR